MWVMGGREADSAPVRVRKWAGTGVVNFGPDMLVLRVLSLCFLFAEPNRLKVCLVAGWIPC